jgi:hypothetical protein
VSTFDVDQLVTEALLFQTGYLTITDSQTIGGDIYYTLGYPNREVRGALASTLLGHLAGDPRAAVETRRNVYLALAAGDLGALERVFTALFAGIPSDWHRRNQIGGYEGYYASVFYASIAASGLVAQPEDSSSRGRLDLAVRLPGHVYLFEFKVLDAASDTAIPADGASAATAPVGTAPTGAALAQIKDRGYADKYRTDGVPIHLVGIEFSRQQRNITRFDTHTIG